MSAEDEKDVAAEASEEPKGAAKGAAKKAAAKKAVAKKAPAKAAAKKAAAEDESGPDAQTDTVKAPAKKRAAAKKAATEAAAAPGDTGEAQELAKSKEAEKPAKKAARAVASAAKPKATRKVVRARARYVRTSARKARMVCGHIRGKSVQEARAILAFTPRGVARDWSKLLESAVANAESNHELLEDDLVVREAYADEGPTIKRFRPRAMGRATPIRKRTSHLTITLTPRPDGANKKHG
jgi:ribosomal protein L22